METLMEILEEIRPDIDFDTEDQLVDGSVLTSFDILSIITDVSDEFDIKIGPGEIVSTNFNSAQALWDMICRLQGAK